MRIQLALNVKDLDAAVDTFFQDSIPVLDAAGVTVLTTHDQSA